MLSSSLPVVLLEPLRGEDERHVLARVRKRLELHHRLLRRGDADDAVAPRVAVDQLAFDVAQRTRVFVDGEKDRVGHSPRNVAPRTHIRQGHEYLASIQVHLRLDDYTFNRLNF